MIYLKLIRESYLFAIRELVVNKIRTFLSLLGITIGIFAVISVFTIFDSLEKQLRDSVASLGSNVLFIQKWPWNTQGDFPWWKYMNRPQPDLDDLRVIQKQSILAEKSAFMVGKSKTLKNGNNIMEEIEVIGVSSEYNQVMDLQIERGRYFTKMESSSGRQVALIGAEIAENLFPNEDAEGKTFQIGGRKTYVIAVLTKKGQDSFGNSPDKQVIIPVNYLKTFVDLRWSQNTILVKAQENISNEALKNELTGILRSAHSLRPGEEEDFALNETSIISNGFDQFFGLLAGIGWVIGGFSLLVGGFGIANIMFVSVRERTNIIGIQKSLGAKNYFILTQFLFEAIFLSLLGGLFGLFFVFILSLVFTYAADFEMMLNQGNIILGIGVSSIIGLISGLMPALKASSLDPVVAMRSLS
jgi:putative ABC transport system permease protein